MGIQASWKSFVKRCENLLGVTSNDTQVDLVQEIDKSWSGRARNGPIHYHGRGGEDSIRIEHASREPSLRGSREEPNREFSTTQIDDSFEPIDPLNRSRKNQQQRGPIHRTSSEPRNISSLAHLPTPSNLDSASSFQESTVPVTAPVDIHPHHASNAQRHRPPSNRPQRYHNNAAATDLKRHSSTAPSHSYYLNCNNVTGTAHRPDEHHTAAAAAIARHGGLSSALSRDFTNPSNTTAATSSSNESSYGAAAVYHEKKVSPTSHLKRRDSAMQHNESDSNGESAMLVNKQHGRHGPMTREQQQHYAGDGLPIGKTNHRDGVASRDVHEEEYSEAFRSLQSTFPDPGMTPGGTAGVIVIDTSLATDWNISHSAIAASKIEESFIPRHVEVSGFSGDVDVDSVASPVGGDGTDDGVLDSANSNTCKSSNSDGAGASVSEDAPMDSSKNAVNVLVNSSSNDWNAKFIRRWKAVRHRARLQALGVRSLWKLNSPRNEHHLPELLVHDISTTIGVDKGTKAPGATSSSMAMKANRSRHDMTRDPSLATMLLSEEVAEVC